MHLIKDHAQAAKTPARFAATKLVDKCVVKPKGSIRSGISYDFLY